MSHPAHPASEHPGAHHAARATQRLAYAFATTALIGLVEAIGGHLSGSLALWADAGHMLVDLLALGLAYVTSRTSIRPADSRRTWGYRRIEVLGALVNGVLLLGVSLGVCAQAVARWQAPEPIELSILTISGGIGLLANVVGIFLLHEHHGHLGVRSALWHVIGDTLSSVGVMATALALYLGASPRIDAITSVGIAVVIAIGAVRLAREVVDVLLESVPVGIDAQEVRVAMASLEGVLEVHDLHIWSITVGMCALCAHVVLVRPDIDAHAVRAALEEMLQREYALVHTTLQIEHHATPHCGCA